MSSHTCRPGHEGILADDCERCDEHSRAPMLLTLDQEKMAALWDKMVKVEHSGEGRYTTDAEARAARTLYAVAVWMERFLGTDPWRPFAAISGLRPWPRLAS